MLHLSFAGLRDGREGGPGGRRDMVLTAWVIQAALYLTPAPAVLDFGSLPPASRSMQSVYLNNTGTGDVTISKVTAEGSGFSITGPAPPVTVKPGQSTAFQVTFAPEAAGRATGVVTVESNAAPVTIRLSGTGAVAHRVVLSWTESTSPGVVGYNILRGTAQGGPYVNLNASPVAGTTYMDLNVMAGETYYYVCTAVDGGNRESAYSNEARADIPAEGSIRRDEGAIRIPGRRGANR